MTHGPSIRAIPFDEPLPSGVAGELLTERQRQHLAGIATVRLLPPRTRLFSEGEPATAIFIVSRGVLKAFRELRNGRRCVVAFWFTADVLGLAEAGRYVNCAESLTPATVYVVPLDLLKESFKRDDALQFRFLCKVTHELRESQRRTIAMSRRDASGKLAMFLQSLERNPVLRDGGTPSAIWLPMTRADIAGYIGLTQEALSRATARMTRQGIIKFPNRHQVQIVDSAGLRALAETD